MAINKRAVLPGVLNQRSHSIGSQPKSPRAAQPKLAQPPIQRAPIPPAHIQRKTNLRTAGAGPHINQHSAHLQRVVQAKMAQPRMTPPQPLQRNQPNFGGGRSAVPAVSSRVVQPAGCLDAVGNFFGSCWRGLTSCWPSSPEVESESTELIPPVRVEVRNPTMKLVDEEDTVLRVAYPARLNAGYISSCALVMFCGDDDFDCYHAKGGSYKAIHGMRSNPKRIYYVYKALVTDPTETIDEYRRNAELFRNSGGRAQMVFLGQTGVNGNILVDMLSLNEIGPTIGGWRQ